MPDVEVLTPSKGRYKGVDLNPKYLMKTNENLNGDGNGNGQRSMTIDEATVWLRDRIRLKKEEKVRRYAELNERRRKGNLQGFRDGAARLWQLKLKDKLRKIHNQITQTEDIGKKINLLSNQNMVQGALIVVCTNVGADGVISNASLLTTLFTENIFTEEEIEPWMRL